MDKRECVTCGTPIYPGAVWWEFVPYTLQDPEKGYYVPMCDSTCEGEGPQNGSTHLPMGT